MPFKLEELFTHIRVWKCLMTKSNETFKMYLSSSCMEENKTCNYNKAIAEKNKLKKHLLQIMTYTDSLYLFAHRHTLMNPP